MQLFYWGQYLSILYASIFVAARLLKPTHEIDLAMSSHAGVFSKCCGSQLLSVFRAVSSYATVYRHFPTVIINYVV